VKLTGCINVGGILLVGGVIILKWIIKIKSDVVNLTKTDSGWDPVKGSRENGSGFSVCKRKGKIWTG
jgi:hypothetical protein